MEKRTMPYSRSAKKTMKMQTTRYMSMALSCEELVDGAIERTLLKMLTSTRNSVTSSAILPGTTEGRIRNEIQETTTNRMQGRYIWNVETMNTQIRGEDWAA